MWLSLVSNEKSQKVTDFSYVLRKVLRKFEGYDKPPGLALQDQGAVIGKAIYAPSKGVNSLTKMNAATARTKYPKPFSRCLADTKRLR